MELEKQNAMKQGIMSDDNCMAKFIKLRINTKDKNVPITQDLAIANAYGNKFIIPLDFEMLNSSIPYYQSRLGNRLCSEIMFNDYGRVTVSTEASPDVNCKISDISLGYKIVIQPDLARRFSDKYQNMALMLDRVLRHRQIRVNKLDMTSNLIHLIYLVNP